GNLLIPNENYCVFEDWVTPILNAMADEQVRDGVRWTPSKIIHRLGKEINHEDSVYYWCYKHNIPVFCPALTDGSLGDMMYFNSYLMRNGADYSVYVNTGQVTILPLLSLLLRLLNRSLMVLIVVRVLMKQ